MFPPESGERQQNDRRRLLHASVCAMLLDHGFSNAQNAAVETLVEILQSLICELSRSSQSYSELCGRSSPLFVDVFIAMVEMGLNTQTLVEFGRRKQKHILPQPQIAQKQSIPKILQAGEKKSLCHYIPDYFPSFPDAHSYIRTPTHKQPVTEYEAIREKASSQKRDLERALTRFMARTNDQTTTHSLFPDEQSSQIFPLIPLNLKSNSYLSALLPRDQIFENDENNNTFKKNKKKDENNKNSDENSEEKETETKETEENNKNADSFNKTDNESDVLDNPFLRPTKICRRRSAKPFNIGKS